MTNIIMTRIFTKSRFIEHANRITEIELIKSINHTSLFILINNNTNSKNFFQLFKVEKFLINFVCVCVFVLLALVRLFHKLK